MPLMVLPFLISKDIYPIITLPSMPKCLPGGLRSRGLKLFKSGVNLHIGIGIAIGIAIGTKILVEGESDSDTEF